jgi:hypothetical protein
VVDIRGIGDGNGAEGIYKAKHDGLGTVRSIRVAIQWGWLAPSGSCCIGVSCR